jgi:hypothetical protein
MFSIFLVKTVACSKIESHVGVTCPGWSVNNIYTVVLAFTGQIAELSVVGITAIQCCKEG